MFVGIIILVTNEQPEVSVRKWKWLWTLLSSSWKMNDEQEKRTVLKTNIQYIEWEIREGSGAGELGGRKKDI